MPDTLIDRLRRAAAPPPLQSPARNRYFYGKLLDQLHLSMEQRYFNDKRWLVNRLTLGEGVLCGLAVVPSRDRTRLLIGPGVAVDGAGREIIVPVESQPIDPRQPTDDCCAPAGEPIKGAGVVSICLAYLECETEPVPVLVCGCESDQGCEHGTIRERYCVRVTKGAHKPVGVDPKTCAAIVGSPARGKGRREQLCRALSGNCADAQDDCVTLATVELKEDGTIGTIDMCGPRVTIYSNAVLLDLILCLADRVEECCGGHVPVAVKSIAKESGDNQVAFAGQPLPAPTVASVSDQNGRVFNEPVTFQVTSGGGTLAGGVSNATVNTLHDGTAAAPIWTLGNAPGANILRASIASGSSVDFVATGTQRPARTPPRIIDIWPTPGELLTISATPAPTADRIRLVEKWKDKPRIEITFDREMDAATMAATKDWLRVCFVKPEGNNTANILGLTTVHLGVSANKHAFSLEPPNPANPLNLDNSFFVILVRASGANIIERDPQNGTAPLLLDADFASVAFGPNTPTFNALWSFLAPTTPGPAPSAAQRNALRQALVRPATQLPAAGSGNGTPGGDFHSWFEVGKV